MYPKEIYYYGSPQKIKPPRLLKAGPLSLQYENGFLRYIKLGKTEVLRMIYHAVRDHNWDTMQGNIVNEVIKTFDDSFHISYLWKGETFSWNCDIKGMANGEIIFEIEGLALKDMKKNRTGFCILHPVIACAGTPCKIEHPDGTIDKQEFPKHISPHQPFMDIQAMQWPLTSECEARLTFEGDIFETEDQRNWTDDSYKTYCTPLAIPFPVQLKTGDSIRQVVKLSFMGKVNEMVEENNVIKLSPVPEINITSPKIGIEEAKDFQKLDNLELPDLAIIPFDHYRVEIKFNESWTERLITGIFNAEKLGLPIELVLFFSDQFTDELNQLLSQIGDKKYLIKFILLLQQQHKTTPQLLIDGISGDIRAAFPDAELGAGTNEYFTELNREPVKPENLDFLSYSLNPQVHAFDHASLTETLAAQGYTVDKARILSKNLPIHISPITLYPRFNPNATGPEPIAGEGELPLTSDVRQMALYGAVWTLGSIIHLAQAGVRRITYYQTVGMEGIIFGNKENSIPDKFYSQRGARFPMWYVFHQVLRNKFMKWIPLETTAPLKVKGIFFQDESRHQLILANYTEQKLDIEASLPLKFLDIFSLNENNVEKSMTDPHFLEKEPRTTLETRDGVFHISIPPFGIVFGEKK